jgi:hypothetical protein
VSASEPYDLVVDPDGAIRVPADQVARLGLRPGEHLRLVRNSRPAEQPPRRRSVRGLGVGQIAPEDVLTWKDFEAAHDANVRAAEVKYGS